MALAAQLRDFRFLIPCAIGVAEAGGIVTDAGGKPLDFSKGRYLDLDTGIIATNAALMPVLLAAVQTCLKGEQPTESSKGE